MKSVFPAYTNKVFIHVNVTKHHDRSLQEEKLILFKLGEWVTYCDIQFYHTHNTVYILTKHSFKAHWISLTVRCLQLLINLCLARYIQTPMWRQKDDLSKDHFRLLQTGKLQIDKFINFHHVYITDSCSFVTALPYQLHQLNPLQNQVHGCHVFTNCTS
jgi:hypothetical protein